MTRQPIVADDLRSHAAAQEQFAKSNAASSGEAAQLSSADEDALRALGYIE